MRVMFLKILINEAGRIFHVFIFKFLSIDFCVFLILSQPHQDLFISPWDKFLKLALKPNLYLLRTIIEFLFKFGEIPCEANQKDLWMVSI